MISICYYFILNCRVGRDDGNGCEDFTYGQASDEDKRYVENQADFHVLKKRETRHSHEKTRQVQIPVNEVSVCDDASWQTTRSAAYFDNLSPSTLTGHTCLPPLDPWSRLLFAR